MCTGITEIDIPESVEDLGDDAFFWCANVYKLRIGDGVKTINYDCFAGLAGYIGLSYLYVGNNVEYIGPNAFESLNSTGTFVIPNKVTYMGALAFYNSKISSIVLGSSLEKLGDACVKDMVNLKSVYCKSKMPPSFENIEYHDPFSGTPMLYSGIPIGSKEAYEQAEPWKNFMVIEEIDYNNFVIPGTN